MRTGSFISYVVVNGDSLVTSFNRTEEIQIELFNQKQDTFDIRWLNDCEYVLTKRNPANRYEAKPNQVKIISTSENAYNYEFSVVGDSKKLKGTALKN